MERRFHTALFAKNCWERIFAQHCSHCYSGTRKSHQLCSNFLFCMELRPPQARKNHSQKRRSSSRQKPSETIKNQHPALTSIELYDGKSPDWTCKDTAIKGKQVMIATGKILAICFPPSERKLERLSCIDFPGKFWLYNWVESAICHCYHLPQSLCDVNWGEKNEVQNEVKTRSESWPTATNMGFTYRSCKTKQPTMPNILRQQP